MANLTPETEKQLTNLSPGDRIELEKSITGEITVVDHKTKAEIIADEFSHLQGQEINVTAASQKYSNQIHIPYQTFSRWAKAGYIKILRDDGYWLILDEADVAYCAKIYRKKFELYDGQMAGRRIFDKYGNPYIRKFPELAERKRRQRRENQR